MVNVATGSSGNFSYLLLEPHLLVFFDIGISFRQISKALKKGEIDIKDPELKVLVLVSHEHTDHWKPKTYYGITKTFPQVTMIMPDSDLSFMWEGYSIDCIRFTHGDTFTSAFIVDMTYGYLTDCDNDEAFSVLLHRELYHLDELLLEANWDEYFLNYLEQIKIANGYDPMTGFTRHLSKQRSEYLVRCLQPREVQYIHQSARFYRKENINEQT